MNRAHTAVSRRTFLIATAATAGAATWPRFGGDFFWPPRLARNPDNHAPVTAIRNKHEGAIGR